MKTLRVLIAYDRTHAAYAGALECAILELYPDLRVRVAPLPALEEEISSFAPHLVVSSRAADGVPGAGAAWFRLPTDPAEPSEFRLDGRRWTCTNPDLGALTRIVDGMEGPARAGDTREPAGPGTT